MTKHDEALEKVLWSLIKNYEVGLCNPDLSNPSKNVDQAIRQINALFNKKKSEAVLDEGKMLLIANDFRESQCKKCNADNDSTLCLVYCGKGKCLCEQPDDGDIIHAIAQAGIKKLGKEIGG